MPRLRGGWFAYGALAGLPAPGLTGPWSVLPCKDQPLFPAPIPTHQPQPCHFSEVWSSRLSLPNSLQEDGVLRAVHPFQLLKCYMTSALSQTTANRTLHLMKGFPLMIEWWKNTADMFSFLWGLYSAFQDENGWKILMVSLGKWRRFIPG